MGELSRIRIFPLTEFDFETEEIAKLEIANGLERALCQTPAKKYKLYKISINKSLHFA